jgi:hypothetical protein
MSSRLKNILGAFGVSIALWVVIIQGSMSLMHQHSTAIDVGVTASIR